EIRLYDSGFVSILGNNGTYAAHIRPELLGHTAGDGDSLKGVSGAVAGIQAGQVFTAIADSPEGELLNVLHPIHVGQTATPWSLMVTVPHDEVLADANWLRDIAILVGLASMVIGGGVAWFFGRGLARPVITMTAAMTRLAKGDTSVEIPARDRRDEIGHMANAVQVFKD